MKLRFTEEAVNDLERLREFVRVKNPAAAQRISMKILSGLEKLKTFPKAGLPVKRSPQPNLMRDLFVGDYTVRYLLGDSEIFVLRVWHNKEAEKDNK